MCGELSGPFERRQLLEPGKIMVSSFARSTRANVSSGHRLRLDISNSNFRVSTEPEYGRAVGLNRSIKDRRKPI